MMDTQRINIKKLHPNTGQIPGLPANPRSWTKAEVQKIAKSLKETPELFEARPIIVYPQDGEYIILGGNLRYEGCKANKEKDAPCFIVPADTPIDKLKEIVIKDNGSFGEWDYDALANLWDDLPLPEWGVPAWDTQAAGGIGDIPQEVEEDDFNEEQEEIHVRCKLGDVWQLGEHRLMCGDSTDLEEVKRLMGGAKADLMITDPPYGVSYADKNKFLNMIAPGNRIQVEIENDHRPEQEMYDLWLKVFTNAYEVTNQCMAYYVFGAQGGELLLLLLLQSLKDSNFAPRHGLVWVKNNHVLGRADYNYKHEPITYGWKTDGTHKFYAKFDTSVWEDELDIDKLKKDELDIDKLKKDELVKLIRELFSDKVPTSVIKENKPLKNDLHPTMKPVRLIGRLMKNSSREGDGVLDLFGGSGTTLIAAEQLGRKCYMMELDPHYCDVIIARWEKLTGREAVKIN